MLAVVTVFIVDLSGFTETWKTALGRWLGVTVGRVKPLDCSLCMTWWACVVYLLCSGHMSMGYLAVAALLSLSTTFLGELMVCLRELLRGLVRILWTLNDKL